MKFLLICLALFVSTVIAAPEVEYVCEQDTLGLSCSKHRQLHILGAIYGRNMTGEQRCPHTHIRETSGCAADQSLEIVRGECDGKENCTVAASNSVFGDPCYGTYKYLEVQYSCIFPELHEYVCEHSDLVLGCDKEHRIDIINASYGRHVPGEERCPHTHIQETSGCAADQSLEIVRGECDDKENCTVAASNSVFGDPCYGTYKYLEVQYSCIFTKLHEYVCEHSDLVLGCDKEHRIDIINASYGRHVPGEERCPHTHIQTTECHAGTSQEKVYSACQGKQNCTVPAENSVFGDPCINTYKYLEVDYSCHDFKN